MTMLDDAPATTEDMTDDDGDDGGEVHLRPAAAPVEPWWSTFPTMVVLALAVLVIAGAVVLWQQNQDLTGARDDRQDAASVAGEFATAVLSYDHRNLDGSVDAVVALSTPDWGREYENAWFQEQQPVVEELDAVARVDVRDVMLGEESDGVLPAIVVFNATIESQIGTRRLGGSYLRLDLVRHDGAWRVDDMAYLASTDQSLDAAPGTGGGNTPTATTVP